MGKKKRVKIRPDKADLIHPRGDMCIGCCLALHDCSELSFKEMPMIEQYIMCGRTFIEVKCDNFIARSKV